MTVGDVYSPKLTNYDSEEKISDVISNWESLCRETTPSDPLEYISLIERQGQVVGWIDFSDLVAADPERQEKVKTCMRSVNVHSLITAETPLLEAMKLFNSQSPYCFLVIKGNIIVGAFSYQDLLSTPFRACLFSMLLSIEQTMVKIVQRAPELAVSKLKQNKIKRIKGEIRKRGSSQREASKSEILENVYFADLLTIITSCGRTKSLLPSLDSFFTECRNKFTGKSVEGIKKKRVDQIVDLRNALAHPKEPWRISVLLAKEDLQNFFEWLNAVESELIAVMNSGDKLAD